MPHILITNDDGIHAPGLRALVDALKDDATVTVVAPSRERSAAAQSLTLRQPIYWTRSPRTNIPSKARPPTP